MQQLNFRPRAQAFDMFDCYNEVNSYGFYVFNAKKILEGLNEEILFSKEHPNYLPAEGLWPPYDGPTDNHRLIFERAARELGQEYGFNKTKIHVCQYWSNGGPRIEKWHNDACENDGSYEFALNCYFDDVVGDEGLLQYKPMDDKEDKCVHTYRPQKYDTAVLDHTKSFLHRVTPTTQRRRVLVITGKVLAECL